MAAMVRRLETCHRPEVADLTHLQCSLNRPIPGAKGRTQIEYPTGTTELDDIGDGVVGFRTEVPTRGVIQSLHVPSTHHRIGGAAPNKPAHPTPLMLHWDSV